MKLALLQHDIVWEDPQANFTHLQPLIAEAAGKGAQLVLLCEMFSYGFSMDTRKIAEPSGGVSAQFLVEQASQNGVWIGGSLPELAGGDAPIQPTDQGARPKNTFVLASPDGRLSRYAKIHPFGYGGETDHYKAGADLMTTQVSDLSVSLSVCYDLRFSYLYWRQAKETDLFVIVANWPAKRRYHWRSLLVARAIENQTWVAGVNRVGSGGGIDYCGDSLVINPQGEIVADGDISNTPNPEMTIYADIDPDITAQTRRQFPFLADRLANFGNSLTFEDKTASDIGLA